MSFSLSNQSIPEARRAARWRPWSLWVALTVLLALGLGQANAAGDAVSLRQPSVVEAKAVWSVAEQAALGDQRVLAVVLDIREHFHINPAKERIPAGSYRIPTGLEVVDAPKALQLGAVQYPMSQQVRVRYTGESEAIEAYQGRVIFYLPVTVTPGAPLGSLAFKLRLTSQACDETSCLPPVTNEIPVRLEIVAGPVAAQAENRELFAGFDLASFGKLSPAVQLDFFGWSLSPDPSRMVGLTLLLALAALGGMLLNFTPCVLPVIPIKIMGLSRAAGNRTRCLLLGLMMALGVVAFWVGLGAAISVVSGFTATNQLFQYPAFTMAVGVVMAIMALGMGGFFTVRLPQWIYRLNPQHGSASGSLGFGVMTAVLSTPCTAPFMGGAAAWAVTQRPAITLATFAAIGAGMALPYLLLSIFPRLLERMPRTGPASELIKQVMGLLMLAAAAYFIGAGISGWRVTPPDPPSRLYWWAVFALVAAAGLWIALGAFRLTRAIGKRVLFGVLGLALLAGSIYEARQLTDRGPIAWTYYTPQRLEEALRSGKVVVMDFTAEWCLNCKVIEATVLHDARVVKALERPGVVAMKVDLTGNNEAGNAKLRQVGRLAIPALVVFAPDGSQKLNSDAYTAEQVTRAIEEAGG